MTELSDWGLKVSDEFVEMFCERLIQHRYRIEPDKYPPTWDEFKIKHPDRVERFRADARFGLSVLIPFLQDVLSKP